jgi:diadenosine tetraphosphate (Ap4A) HIT family hydrolase
MNDIEAWKLDRIGSARAGTNPTVLGSMDALGHAIETACRASDTGFRRMNYEILGNTDAYLHAHLFPRYQWEPQDRISGPVWLYDPEEFYGPEAALAPRHEALRSGIVTELAKVGATVQDG